MLYTILNSPDHGHENIVVYFYGGHCLGSLFLFHIFFFFFLPPSAKKKLQARFTYTHFTMARDSSRSYGVVSSRKIFTDQMEREVKISTKKEYIRLNN